MSFCVSPQPASLRTCSGSMFGTMLSASSRSSLAVAQRAPAGWVAVEATFRPRQFGYETPQLRLERRLHAGSPYRSNDLVSAGPEPPLSYDLRLNHALISNLVYHVHAIIWKVALRTVWSPSCNHPAGDRCHRSRHTSIASPGRQRAHPRHLGARQCMALSALERVVNCWAAASEEKSLICPRRSPGSVT